jgi:hypothetical protein
MVKMGVPPSAQQLWIAIQQEVIGVHAYWNNYRQLFGKSKERVDLRNACAGEFFLIVQDALLTDVQLSLSRLAERVTTSGKKNATLESLSSEIAMLSIPQLAGRLQDYRDRCDKITLRRNKELAHADLGALLRRNGFAGGTAIPGPSRQEIEEALKALREFMNAVEGYFNDPPMDYETFASPGDGDSLVEILKQGLAYG